MAQFFPRAALRRPRPTSTARLLAVVGLVLALGFSLTVWAPEASSQSPLAPSRAHHNYSEFSGAAGLRPGAKKGVRIRGKKAVLVKPPRTIKKGRHTYETGRWRSRWVRPSQPFTELVPSWHVRTPARSWVKVQARVVTDTGQVSRWKNLAIWSTRDGRLHRKSGGKQADQLVRVATDTLLAQPGVQLTGWQLRIQLAKAPQGKSPKLFAAGAVASAKPAAGWQASPTSTPRHTTPVLLEVPTYSQMTHRGQHPQFGGGGQAWCSPTSLAMVLGYYQALPPPKQYRWVGPTVTDPWVNHLARLSYDYRYQGTGNWPFTTAIGAARTGAGFVTRLNNLRQAERFIRQGIPLIMSIKFGPGQLTGAPLNRSAGHLLVLVGFDAAGNPIVNDPAAPTNSTVQRTYDRAELEALWQTASGGLTYVIHDRAHPLPPAGKNLTNW